MDNENLPRDEAEAKKPPRKPRPSEIAAKKAKKKPKMKPKAKRAPAKKAKKAKKKPKMKPKARTAPAVRTERLDLRVSKTEKRKVIAKALKMRRTITSLVLEAIEKLK